MWVAFSKRHIYQNATFHSQEYQWWERHRFIQFKLSFFKVTTPTEYRSISIAPLGHMALICTGERVNTYWSGWRLWGLYKTKSRRCAAQTLTYFKQSVEASSYHDCFSLQRMENLYTGACGHWHWHLGFQLGLASTTMRNNPPWLDRASEMEPNVPRE